MRGLTATFVAVSTFAIHAMPAPLAAAEIYRWVDAQGQLKVVGLPIGEYELRITREHFASFTQRVEILEGTTMTVKALLHRIR